MIDVSNIDVEPCQPQRVALFCEECACAVAGRQRLAVVSEQQHWLNRSTERARQFFFVALVFEKGRRLLMHFDSTCVLIEHIERVRARAQTFR